MSVFVSLYLSRRTWKYVGAFRSLFMGSQICRFEDPAVLLQDVAGTGLQCEWNHHGYTDGLQFLQGKFSTRITESHSPGKPILFPCRRVVSETGPESWHARRKTKMLFNCMMPLGCWCWNRLSFWWGCGIDTWMCCCSCCRCCHCCYWMTLHCSQVTEDRAHQGRLSAPMSVAHYSRGNLRELDKSNKGNNPWATDMKTTLALFTRTQAGVSLEVLTFPELFKNNYQETQDLETGESSS